MAKIINFSSAEKAMLNKAGFKTKRPKKPKASSSLLVKENWIGRNNEWVRKGRVKLKDYKQKIADKVKAKKIAEDIRRA